MPIYSHSQLSTYEDCPLKYRFRYRDRIKRDVDTVEAFMGSRVHDVLEKCYKDLRFSRVNSLEHLLAYYNKIWQEKWDDKIVINNQELAQNDYKTLGEKLIETYYKRYAPFDADITIQTEMRLGFSLDDDGKYRIQGYIDRLSRTPDGTYEIHDYKTSARLPGQDDADNDRQLGLYHLGIQKKWPDVKDIRLIWHYLAFDTELVSYRTEEEISQLIRDIKGLIDEIEASTDFPPRESRLCDWCEYQDLCPLKKHFVKIEALPVNEYLNEPGVMLVDKYAALKHEAESIDDEMKKVREAILDYAKKEEVVAIKGSDYKVQIKFGEDLKFPVKSDAERSELEGMIKEAGKWEEVSQLDAISLKRVVQSNQWSKDLIDNVMKYGRIEESNTVRLSRLRNEEK